MTYDTQVLEASNFSTGNGGARMSVVRRTWPHAAGSAEFYLENEVSHYGLFQTGITQIQSVPVLDEMIDLLQRARQHMVDGNAQPTYPGTASISRQIVNGENQDYSRAFALETASLSASKNGQPLSDRMNVGE